MRRKHRRAPRGLTLIEITIAIAVVAVLFAAVTFSVGAITGARAKTSAGELAGVIRSLYDTAALRGKTCRLVFEMPDPKADEGVVRYHAECAAGAVTTTPDREALLRADNERREDEAKGRRDRRERRDASETPSLDELMAREQERVEQSSRFSNYTSEEIPPRELPSGVTLSVWTRHQREPVEKGVAYLYFFPQGYTEKAQLYVRQGDNVWTLSIAPLTGKVSVAAEALEVPRS